MVLKGLKGILKKVFRRKNKLELTKITVTFQDGQIHTFEDICGYYRTQGFFFIELEENEGLSFNEDCILSAKYFWREGKK